MDTGKTERTLSLPKKRNGLKLDPRTKLLLLLTVTTLMFSTGSEGTMGVLKFFLSLIPFLLLVLNRRYRTAGKYLLLYIVCFVMERAALMYLSGLPSFLIMAVTSVMTRFAPGMMVGAYLVESTTVSEFVAAMERMHVTEKIIIPMSVIFRFIPTIAEEYRSIRDAMRMRGIRLGGNKPLELIEYRLVPLMVSIVRIGDDLSAAALTRGLGAPIRRTNCCEIGFHSLDIFLSIGCVSAFAVFLIERIAG